MGLLLYKSDEMFSSTELIRKSKSIFDKILGKKIDKAIILRDGKPSFLLMEFAKYEKIMAEYEELKRMVESGDSINSSKKKKKKNKEQKQLRSDLEKQAKKISFDSGDYAVDKNIEVSDEVEEKPQVEEEPQKLVAEEKTDESQNSENALTQEQEIQKAYERIEAMNLEDDMKHQAKQKVRLKIIKAREERALLAQEQEKKLQEEKELERQVEAEKQKKEQELEEFWD